MISPVEETSPSVVKIENLGPIEHLEIPARPGTVVVLEGPNGAGKSTVLEAVNAAVAKRPAGLTSRDGTVGGSAFVMGVTIKVTRNGRNRRLNDCVVAAVEDRLNIASFVDPGLKDVGAADLRRIKSMANMVGAEITLDNLYELVHGRDEFESIVGQKSLKLTDPVDLIEGVKRDLEQAARNQTTAAENAHRAAVSKQAENEGLDLNAPCDETLLRQQLTDAIQRQSQLTTARAGWNDRLKDAEQARTAIAKAEGDYKGPTIEEAHNAAERTKELENQQAQRINALERQLAEIQKELDIARPQLESARRETQSAEQIESAAIAHRDAIAGWQKTIDDSTAGGCPCSDDDIAQAATAVKAAQDAMDLGTRVRDGLKRDVDAKQREQEAEAFRATSERYRNAAQGTLDVLAQAVLSASTRIRFGSDFRLVVDHEHRGECYFDDLSHGERWALALDLVLDAAQRRGVPAALAIPQEAWEGLDADNRQMVIDKVAGSNLIVFTAEASRTPNADSEIVPKVLTAAV